MPETPPPKASRTTVPATTDATNCFLFLFMVSEYHRAVPRTLRSSACTRFCTTEPSKPKNARSLQLVESVSYVGSTPGQVSIPTSATDEISAIVLVAAPLKPNKVHQIHTGRNRPAELLLSHNRDMVTLDILRTERREEILRLAGQRGAHSLRVFGSVARNEANENSDLDLLVTWEPGRSLLDHAGLVQDLEDLLGIKVHIGTEKSLHSYVRERILREATPL
jgi:uncharacterized protein